MAIEYPATIDEAEAAHAKREGKPLVRVCVRSRDGTESSVSINDYGPGNDALAFMHEHRFAECTVSRSLPDDPDRRKQTKKSKGMTVHGFLQDTRLDSAEKEVAIPDKIKRRRRQTGEAAPETNGQAAETVSG